MVGGRECLSAAGVEMADDGGRARDRHGAARRAERLQQDVARIAGDIARTEDQVAATRRRLADRDPARADEHLAAVADAEEFAAHERAEQRRWQERES